MGYLPAAIIVSLAMSISIFNASGSFLLAFLAYSLTGTSVLLSVLLTEAQKDLDEGQFSTTE